MDDALTVFVAGVPMYGRPGLGPFAIVKDGLDGWDDGVALKSDKQAFAQAAGSYVQRRFQESRTVTLTGVILAKSQSEREVLGNRISGLLSDGRTGRIQVTKGGLTQWADASIDSSSVDPVRGTTRSDFQLQLWCPDPRKYGELREFPATVGAPVQAFHRGNFEALPVVEVTGSMPGGYTLTFAGGTVWVMEPLVSGTPHEIDYSSGRLKVGGVIVHGRFGTTNILPLPSGTYTNASIVPVTTGTATAKFKVLDTYI